VRGRPGQRVWTTGIVLAVLLVFVWARLGCRARTRSRGSAPASQTAIPDQSAKPVPDLSVTSPLNVPGGGAAPADAYGVYSALYQEQLPEPLVFSDESVTDIPQVNESCLQPSSQEERDLVDAFVAANRQSHHWEAKFVIPAGYKVITHAEAAAAQECIVTRFQDAVRCAPFKGVRHVRYLGVPGFDPSHTHALVSVIRVCGGECGSGGIFEVEKADGTWRRSAPSAFTQECTFLGPSSTLRVSPNSE
jgi:hypothetical protein